MRTSSCQLSRLTAQGVVQAHRLYQGFQGDGWRQAGEGGTKTNERGASEISWVHEIKREKRLSVSSWNSNHLFLLLLLLLWESFWLIISQTPLPLGSAVPLPHPPTLTHRFLASRAKLQPSILGVLYSSVRENVWMRISVNGWGLSPHKLLLPGKPFCPSFLQFLCFNSAT